MSIEEPEETETVESRRLPDDFRIDRERTHERDVFLVGRVQLVDTDDGLAAGVDEWRRDLLSPVADVLLVHAGRGDMSLLACFPLDLGPEAA